MSVVDGVNLSTSLRRFAQAVPHLGDLKEEVSNLLILGYFETNFFLGLARWCRMAGDGLKGRSAKGRGGLVVIFKKNRKLRGGGSGIYRLGASGVGNEYKSGEKP
jgi:hypothetical protein